MAARMASGAMLQPAAIAATTQPDSCWAGGAFATRAGSTLAPTTSVRAIRSCSDWALPGEGDRQIPDQERQARDPRGKVAAARASEADALAREIRHLDAAGELAGRGLLAAALERRDRYSRGRR